MAKVSVIIPVYNVEKYIGKCIDSIINQTYRDIEIICVNDGSTDNSLNILRDYAQKDNRIIIISQENQGAAIARNNGLNNAKGDYICFLDSDDYVEYTFLETMYKQITLQNSDMCLCKSKYVFNDKLVYCHSDIKTEILHKPIFSVQDIPDKIFQICSIPCFTKLYRTEFIKNNGLEFQNLKSSNDVFFNTSTLVLANRITYVDEYLVISRREREGSISNSRGKHVFCILKAVSALKDLLVKKDLFKTVEKSFYEFCQMTFLYEAQCCMDKQLQKDFMREVKEFLPKKYWQKLYNKYKTRGISQILKLLFSITNEYENNTKHKIITILGINLKFKVEKRKMNFIKKEIFWDKQKCKYTILGFVKITTKLSKKYIESELKKDKLSENPTKFPIRLTPNEKNMLISYMKNAKQYLEFGSGGSTYLAVLNSDANIISIESDENWIKYIKEWNILSKTDIRYIDIGKIGDWGVPVNEDKKSVWYKYSSEVFNDENARQSDFIFIDGRFRVACALATILNTNENVTIAIHDFWVRPEYHVLLKYLEVIEGADTLAVFKKRNTIDIDEIKRLYDEYKTVLD